MGPLTISYTDGSGEAQTPTAGAFDQNGNAATTNTNNTRNAILSGTFFAPMSAGLVKLSFSYTATAGSWYYFFWATIEQLPMTATALPITPI